MRESPAGRVLRALGLWENKVTQTWDGKRERLMSRHNYARRHLSPLIPLQSLKDTGIHASVGMHTPMQVWTHTNTHAGTHRHTDTHMRGAPDLCPLLCQVQFCLGRTAIPNFLCVAVLYTGLSRDLIILQQSFAIPPPPTSPLVSTASLGRVCPALLVGTVSPAAA